MAKTRRKLNACQGLEEIKALDELARGSINRGEIASLVREGRYMLTHEVTGIARLNPEYKEAVKIIDALRQDYDLLF